MSAAPISIAPDRLRFLASLPFFGQAEALIRAVDPWWKFEGELRTYTVNFECEGDDVCPTCGCDCGNWGDAEEESIEVDACSPEEAEEIAKAIMAERGDWEFVSVDKPRQLGIKLPLEAEVATGVADFAKAVRWLPPIKTKVPA